MSKNLEDLLYRGDSLEKMSTMSSDLRDASKKYRRAAVKINWQLLIQQVRMSYCEMWQTALTATVRPLCGARLHHTVLLHLALLVEILRRNGKTIGSSEMAVWAKRASAACL